jgi:hypothetical protein
MLPEKRREPEESEGGRGGFEVHVIGGGPSSSASPAGNGIEIGINIGGRNPAAVPSDDAPVHRLEPPPESQAARLKATSEVGPAIPRVSSRRKKRNAQQWTLWMAAGSCLLVVLAVAWKLNSRSSRQEPKMTGQQTPEVAPVLDPVAAERKYLFDNFGTLSLDAGKLLEEFAAAKTAGEALPLIRSSSLLADRFASAWQPWGSVPLLSRAVPLEPALDAASPQPAILIRGAKGNAKSFVFYFVRESGKLRIDWEASEGRGDLTIEDLESGAAATDAVVRASISPAKYFSVAFPESAFRSYQLSDLGKKHSIWAFAPIDSEAALTLTRNLNQDSLILAEGASSMATLKVTRRTVDGANIFLITDLLHNGWVSP